MKTRKKISAENGVQHVPILKHKSDASVVEHSQVIDKRVLDLITSAKKQKPEGSTKATRATNKVSKKNHLEGNEFGGTCLSYAADDMASNSQKGWEEGTECCTSETIFSPTFHIYKNGASCNSDVGEVETIKREDEVLFEGTKGMDCLKYFDLPINGFNIDEGVDADGNNRYVKSANSSMPHLLNSIGNGCDNTIASEVSAIYLAMQKSKLECIEESSDNSMSVEVCVETDEDEEVDDFDPYLFIKNLPELSAVVPTFRPVLLPKQTRSCPSTTLVLDLDETLVHSSLEYCEDADFTFKVKFNFVDHTVYVRCRPFLKEFMERVSSLFEIIVFTASQSIYAEQLLNVLDPKRKLFRHRVFRESCVYLEGNYLKDLSVLGRDLARVIIVDNSPQAFGFQVDNGIPIESWFSDRSDHALLDLLPFLEGLVGVQDVRPIIAERFTLRDKVASAVDLYPILE